MTKPTQSRRQDGDTAALDPPTCMDPRPRAQGKFLVVGSERFFIKGVTYGPLRSADLTGDGPQRATVREDFRRMRTAGFNTVRLYETPARWVLDAAHREGLRVMVGVAWQQHVAFLDDGEQAAAIEGSVRECAAACRDHPAVLCLVLGNEIPSGIVRWHGRRAVERFIGRLYRAAKRVDPGLLVTYANYPTTEYLHLPFLDLVCFNVYLEHEEELRSYLARLHNLAGDRPLLMTELGLDSAAHGEFAQSASLDWQLRAAFEEGCAGAFVFAWTDDWSRGGEEVTGWRFGLTTGDRRPKPALGVVERVLADVPFSRGVRWPRVSVVVCSYNGAATIGECLTHLVRLDYPDYEVIVVDDGSTDATAAIADRFDVRLIRTPNRGLSSARNTGLAAATGEVVAYIDDDAWPDPLWLRYLAHDFLTSDHAAIGGPNLPPPDDRIVARCVALAPGGPTHILLSDREAEHIPGCNMAFRTERLREVGGFDPRFRVAGDDVDICWRLQEKGWTIGFSPSALVWHRPRPSVRTFLRQQAGYGRAEALLEEKWPRKYNGAGHVSWNGRIYGGITGQSPFRLGTRIYQGVWGTAPFQSEEPAAPALRAALDLPEWYLLAVVFSVLALLGTSWPPLLAALPFALLAAGVVTGRAVAGALARIRATPRRDGSRPLVELPLTALLHALQPSARMWGRLVAGLSPWRRYGERSGSAAPGERGAGTRQFALWSERWRPATWWLSRLQDGLQSKGLLVISGGEYECWDLEVRPGTFGAVRVLAAVEDHAQGRQLVRFRVWPRWGGLPVAVGGILAVLAVAAGTAGAWGPAALLGACGGAVLVRLRGDHARGLWVASEVVKRLPAQLPATGAFAGSSGGPGWSLPALPARAPGGERRNGAGRRADASGPVPGQGSANGRPREGRSSGGRSGPARKTPYDG